jgi:uncharacterized repeat protein (TIGR03837 family)
VDCRIEDSKAIFRGSVERCGSMLALYYSVVTAMPLRAQRWDVFCSVIDNFGDAGVCWRLARQLIAEHALEVHLFVDALPALARIVPALDATRDDQLVDGVQLRRWRGAEGEFSIADPGDAVIEGFGCGLPERYLAAMAARDKQPAWINLEYLSAEAWIEGCHGLASRHPRLPLTRYFFFPGFTAASGGLLRERDLFARRDAFLADAKAQGEHWHRLGTANPGAATTIVSLFCYPQAPVASLLDAWADGDQPILCLVPDGVAASAIDAWSAGAVKTVGDRITRGSLTLNRIPFLSQEDYDRLLWRCDVNFVRGEDSFVRAQWAARPFVWQPYPQTGNAHRLKLEAFLERYAERLPSNADAALRTFSSGWNGEQEAGAWWNGLGSTRRELTGHAKAWADALAALPDLARSLVEFCADRV